MAANLIDEPGTKQQEPEDKRPPSPHDAFFKQTLSSKRLAGIFLRERLPRDLALRLSPGDALSAQNEFVDENLRKKLADKVLRLPFIEQAELVPYFVADAKSEGDRLAIAQVASYCFAIIVNWYTAEREKEEVRPRPAPESMPVVIALIVHSGPYKYTQATELAELAGRVPESVRPWMASLRAVVVDLKDIEDDDLSGDPILRARLRALSHATDRDIREAANLDSVLAGVEQLPEPHRSDILAYMTRVVTGVGIDGRILVSASLKRVAPNQAEKLMEATFDLEIERATAGLREELSDSQASHAMAEAKAAQYRAETVKAKNKARKARAQAAEARAQAAEARALTARTLVAAVQQRMGDVPAQLLERIAGASIETLNGWLTEIIVNNSLESLLATAGSGPGTSTNAAEAHPDAPENGTQQPPES